ncbi:MAG: antibiotic biosynthesis monooxygenase [Chloroflexales bacterium]|nr:antibiotic biosynthesis monooxygenase [Chloroflexales bacterium]
MYVTSRTVQTLPGQQLAFVDAWVSLAAHPLKHQPGFKHVYVMAAPGQADTVIIFLVWQTEANMQAWLASDAHRRVEERVAPLGCSQPATADYTLFFEQCACSHHYNVDVLEEDVGIGAPGTDS